MDNVFQMNIHHTSSLLLPYPLYCSHNPFIFLCKTNKSNGPDRSWKTRQTIQCRMCSIFLIGSSCHITRWMYALSFSRSRRNQIFFLCFPVCLIFPENAVPLINNDHKRLLCLNIYILHTQSRSSSSKYSIRIFTL